MDNPCSQCTLAVMGKCSLNANHGAQALYLLFCHSEKSEYIVIDIKCQVVKLTHNPPEMISLHYVMSKDV